MKGAFKWNETHFSSFFKGFLLPKIVWDLRVRLWCTCAIQVYIAVVFVPQQELAVLHPKGLLSFNLPRVARGWISLSLLSPDSFCLLYWNTRLGISKPISSISSSETSKISEIFPDANKLMITSLRLLKSIITFSLNGIIKTFYRNIHTWIVATHKSLTYKRLIGNQFENLIQKSH